MALTDSKVKKLLDNRRKELNAYQLACGYIQREANTTTDRQVDLYHDGCYQVRAHDHREHVNLEWPAGFPTLTAARKEFKRMVRQYL